MHVYLVAREVERILMAANESLDITLTVAPLGAIHKLRGSNLEQTSVL